MRSLHLLILDHDDARRQGVTALFRGAGHVAVVELEGAAGAAALVAPPGGPVPGFELLVLDLTLPGLDLHALRSALAPEAHTSPDSLDAAEARHIARALEHTAGNRRQAALLLGISRSTLLNKIRRYQLDRRTGGQADRRTDGLTD